MKRRLLQFMAGGLLVILTGVAVWTALLYADHGSILVRCGTVPAGENFLDDSRGLLHEISWHLGNGLRTWGRTYGVRVGSAYVSAQVTYVDLKVRPEDAREDE